MRFPLLAQTMKWGSVVVVRQAVRAKQYLWACGVVGMAVLLNPIVPVFTPAGNLMLMLFLVGLAPIVITFAALMDATVTLYPNVITEPYLQGELLIPTDDWAVV